MQEIGKCIGARVRQRRKELRMTQEQLEAASGVPQGSISRIESGVADDIYASTVLGFAKALKVSTDYLFGMEPPRSSTPPTKRQPPRKATDAPGQAGPAAVTRTRGRPVASRVAS